jgi:hypothetical protein
VLFKLLFEENLITYLYYVSVFARYKNNIFIICVYNKAGQGEAPVRADPLRAKMRRARGRFIASKEAGKRSVRASLLQPLATTDTVRLKHLPQSTCRPAGSLIAIQV